MSPDGTPGLRRNLRKAQQFLFVLCCSISCWEVLHVLTARLTLIVQYVPDDAFYYLEIARNLARIGRSSQDGGQTITTGYHLLWAWIVELLAHIVHFQRMPLLRGMVLVSWLLAMGTVLLIARSAWRHSLPLLSVLTLFVASQSFLDNSVSALEWSLALSVSSTAIFGILHHAEPTAFRYGTILLFLLGVVGSLARSDFGGQAFCYFFAAIVLMLVIQEKRFLLPSFSLLSGAILGLGFTFLHDWLLTGDLIQGSARMKSLWSAAAGRSPLPFFPVLVRTVFFLPTTRRKLAHEAIGAIGAHGAGPQATSAPAGTLLFTTLLLLLILASSLLLWSYIALKTSPPSQTEKPSNIRLFLALSASSIIMLYAIVDTFNSFAIQIWYTSQITVAVGILLYLMLTSQVLRQRSSLAYGVIAFITLVNLASFVISRPKYFVQAKGPLIADAMKQQLGPGAIGFSDTGVTNFAYGGTIINLDGLVNNEVIAYAPSRLPCYLLDKKIRYFTGFGEASAVAFHLEPYTDYARLAPLQLSDGTATFIFETDPGKLAALPICARAR